MAFVPAHRRKKDPFGKAKLAPRIRPATDPCMCLEQCPHGTECGGGHSSSAEHWFPCCEEGCFQPAFTVFDEPDGLSNWRCGTLGCPVARGPFTTWRAAQESARQHVQERHRVEEAS